ncbi:MAG: carbamate kinase [Bilophila wadsworthia]
MRGGSGRKKNPSPPRFPLPHQEPRHEPELAVIAIGATPSSAPRQAKRRRPVLRCARRWNTSPTSSNRAGGADYPRQRSAGGLHHAALEIARAVAGCTSSAGKLRRGLQGAIGYQIQQSLDNVLKRRGLTDKTGRTVSLVTQVRVDIADPGFSDPDKFVGEFYAEDQLAELHQQHPDWILKPDANRGWRRVVPSPKPCEIIELDAIKNLLDSGFNVVAVGGGGIPVVRMPEGLFGVDAVIDKDLASSLLATQLGADMLAISTGVESVALNYGTPMQRPLHNVPVSEMERYLAEGHFPAGSMGPKIKAAVDFIRNGGSEVVITSPEYLNAALTKGAGTHITKE